MMALGVPAGANRPIDCCETIPGSPASTAVGIAGAAISRVGLVTARMRSLPVRLNSSNAPVTAGVTIATCPLMVSAVAGPEPRYGKSRNCHVRNRLEVLKRIVEWMAFENGLRDVSARTTQENSVAVRAGASDRGGTQRTASSPLVFNHHRAKHRLHLFRPRTPHGV